ncbi:hypothetical protein LNN31_13525 [Acetobacterium wieringae]|uniref:Uncharacterized protein n=1 Tax=Acetobacterium wieringae TaxID=52694 RepID=A0ABY6HE26_9FIRM|nr:hypothetical protein [Acetobacterium wieringae]UYO61796.1 hypothetical protein LNN31_13525 [Acetobacterium wieringae]
MENRFGAWTDNDPALGSLFNERIEGPGNELIEEHNEVKAKVDKIITVSTLPPGDPDSGDNWYKVLT